jgi:hypothetical protein
MMSEGGIGLVPRVLSWRVSDFRERRILILTSYLTVHSTAHSTAHMYCDIGKEAAHTAASCREIS